MAARINHCHCGAFFRGMVPRKICPLQKGITRQLLAENNLVFEKPKNIDGDDEKRKRKNSSLRDISPKEYVFRMGTSVD